MGMPLVGLSGRGRADGIGPCWAGCENPLKREAVFEGFMVCNNRLRPSQEASWGSCQGL